MNLDLATRLENDIDDALGRGDHGAAEALARRYRSEADAGADDRPAQQSPRFRSRWLAAQVALASGRLGDALRLLSPLLPPPPGLPPALACRLWLAGAGPPPPRRGYPGPAE